MKIRPVGAELFHAGGRADGQTDRHKAQRQAGRLTDRQADMTKLTVDFRNPANAFKNYRISQTKFFFPEIIVPLAKLSPSVEYLAKHGGKKFEFTQTRRPTLTLTP
jgi:hypothetical protein